MPNTTRIHRRPGSGSGIVLVVALAGLGTGSSTTVPGAFGLGIVPTVHAAPAASPSAQSAEPRQTQQAPPAAGQDGAGQQAPQEEQQPVFRTGINFVRVDVIVTNKQGDPVDDLTQADFEVSEDGKPQAIETFRLIELTGNPPPGEAPRAIRTDYDEESEAQREDVRIFVFMLDDYHVRLGAAMALREPLINFIRNQLGPMDLIGVMYPLTPVSEIRLTRNHDAIIRVIEKFEGRKYDYRPRNEFETQYSMYPTEIVERIRNQVSLSALEGLAVRLSGLREGRKAIILVSEGYSYYVPPQLRDPVAELPGFNNPAARRPGYGDNSYGEERAQFFQDTELQSDLRDVYAAANRGNTAIYALDPRGLAPFEYDINQGVGARIDRRLLSATMDTLRTLADETDGRAIVNRNDFETAMRQIVRDTSAYYLVGYNSSQAPADGKFHEIKVRVKRPGVQVRARKGYWALSAEDVTRATAPPKPGPDPAIGRALAEVESPSRAEVVRTWIGMNPGEDGRTRVTLVWEPVSATAGSARRAAPARMSVIATSQDGPAYFRGKVPDDNVPDPSTSGTGKGGRTAFEASPGAMQVRLSVEDDDGRVVDSNILDLVVPDFTVPEVALSTLEVHRVRTARDLQLLNADPAPIPVAAREFRRTERLLVRFSVIGPSASPPTAAARLLNRAGQPMTALPVQPVPNKNGLLQVDLPLASLPAGDFLIEISASAGESEAKQFLGFRVVS